MNRPKAAVVVFSGSNGDRDLYETFAAAGFDPFYIRSTDAIPDGTSVCGLPGGFAYGDYWRAGMLASQATAVMQLRKFADNGGLVIGICNGFQILVESGLLPGGLHYNNPPGFRHGWLEVEVQQSTSTPWFAGLKPGQRLRMPMAHGEGNFFHPDGPDGIRDLVPLRYVHNPNGSMLDAAAVLDPSGRILGVMPHPERAADPVLGCDDGLHIFTAAARALVEA